MVGEEKSPSPKHSRSCLCVYNIFVRDAHIVLLWEVFTFSLSRIRLGKKVHGGGVGGMTCKKHKQMNRNIRRQSTVAAKANTARFGGAGAQVRSIHFTVVLCCRAAANASAPASLRSATGRPDTKISKSAMPQLGIGIGMTLKTLK